MQKPWMVALAGAFVLFSFSSCGSNRLQMLEEDRATGYAMYRSAMAEEDADIKNWCKLGIRKVFALNGKSFEYSDKVKKHCPEIEVIYDQEQDPDVRVPDGFLSYFDSEVAKAKEAGTKMLFHCNCGCHRTGRLAGYYRIKYQGWSAEDAIQEMLFIGKDMDHHPSLPAQVRAYEDYLKGRACSQDARFCLTDGVAAIGSASGPLVDPRYPDLKY